MSDIPRQPVNSDEIDLIELTIKIAKFFKKQRWVFIIFILMGVSIGLLYHFTKPSVYQSKMILQSDILTESYSNRVTESFSSLIKEKNWKMLASRLSMTEADAASIKKIEIIFIKNEDAKEGIARQGVIYKNTNNNIIVNAEVYNTEITAKLQDGIVSFLQNIDFVKIRVKQRQIYYSNLVAKIKEEINSLDSLKDKLFQGKPVYAKGAEIMVVDPSKIHTEIIDLTKQKLEYENSLELVESIQVVEGFAVFNRVTTPRLSVVLIAGVVGGFFLGLLFICFQWFRVVTKD